MNLIGQALSFTARAIDLHGEQRDSEALRCLNSALALEPKLVPALYLAADIALSHGDYENGWQLYEYRRWKQDHLGGRYLMRPMWDGRPTQQRVLLWSEQGFGDAIMMARFLPEVKRRCPNLTIAVHPELVRLFRINGFNVEDDDHYTERCNGFDVQCSMMSLPLVLGVRLSNLSGSSYLRPPFMTHTTMVPAGGPCIGLFWHSNSGLDEDATRTRKRRNMTDEQVALLSTQFDFISLHREHTTTFDWAQSAVIVNQLELIVTVDTGIAHLAGALGKPVWLMLSMDCDWRWLQRRTDSPWYNTARLYRQEKLDDWGPVLEAVARDLKGLGYVATLVA